MTPGEQCKTRVQHGVSAKPDRCVDIQRRSPPVTRGRRCMQRSCCCLYWRRISRMHPAAVRRLPPLDSRQAADCAASTFECPTPSLRGALAVSEALRERGAQRILPGHGYARPWHMSLLHCPPPPPRGTWHRQPMNASISGPQASALGAGSVREGEQESPSAQHAGCPVWGGGGPSLPLGWPCYGPDA